MFFLILQYFTVIYHIIRNIVELVCHICTCKGVALAHEFHGGNLLYIYVRAM